MSSRDGSGRASRRNRAPNQGNAGHGAAPRRNQPTGQWDIDPAEIDRYLSGRPTREQESSRSARQPSRDTAYQLDQFQRQRDQTARPAQRYGRPAPAGRQQFSVPEEEPGFEDVYDDYGTGDDDAAYFEDDWYDEPRPARQSVRPAPRRDRRPVREQEPTYYDEDEELYADDPYLTYDDDVYGAPAPAPRRQRPRPGVSVGRPNLPKFTVPRAISEAELVNDRPSLILIGAAILSVAVMAIVISNKLAGLPSVIPTHVSATGVGEALRGRNALWGIPLLASALSLMNIAAGWFLARLDLFATRFLLSASLLVQFVAWIAVLKYLW